jgi:alpha-glucosidase
MCAVLADRGVDGFRLDTINFYFHSRGWRQSAAAARGAQRQTAPAVNPYNFQDHLYDKSRPENLAFLERFRALLDEYPAAATLAKWAIHSAASRSSPPIPPAATACICATPSTSWARTSSMRRQRAQGAGGVWPRRADGWACWALSNHDVVRHASRWGAGEKRSPRLSARCLGAAHVAARLGLPLSGRGARPGRGRNRFRGSAGSLWQDDVAGVQGPRRLPHANGLGERGANGGFSTGKPWLPVPAEHAAHGRRRSTGRPGSMLEHYTALHRVPAQHPVVRQRRHRVSRGRRDVPRLHPKPATSASCAPSISAPQ